MAGMWKSFWNVLTNSGPEGHQDEDMLNVLSFGGRGGKYKDQFEKMIDLSKLDMPNRTYNGIPFDKYKEMADASPTPQERWHNLAAYEILNAPDFAEKQTKKAATDKALVDAASKIKPSMGYMHPESDIAATSKMLGTEGGSSALAQKMKDALSLAEMVHNKTYGENAMLDSARELGVIPRGPGMRAAIGIPAAGAPAAPQIPVTQGIGNAPPKMDMGIDLMDVPKADRALQRPGQPDVGMALQNILGGMAGAAPRVRAGTPQAVPGGVQMGPRVGVRQPRQMSDMRDITQIGGGRTPEQDAELKALARSGDEAAYQKRKMEIDRAPAQVGQLPPDEDRTDPSGGNPGPVDEGGVDPSLTQTGPPDLKQMLMAAMAGNSPDVPGQDPLQGYGKQGGQRFPYLAGMPGASGGDQMPDQIPGIRIYG